MYLQYENKTMFIVQYESEEDTKKKGEEKSTKINRRKPMTKTTRKKSEKKGKDENRTR